MRKDRVKPLKIRLPIFDRILLVLVPVAIGAIFIMIFVSTKEYQNNQVNFTKSVIREMSLNQEVEFEEYIYEKQVMLKSLTTYPEIYEMDKVTQKAFLSQHSEELGFNHIFIMDTEGTGYYPAENITKDQKNEDFYQRLKEYDSYITEPFYSGNGPLTTICEAIYNEDGDKVGTLCGAVHLKVVQKLIENNETILDGMCFMINSDGVYLSSTESSNMYNRVSVYDRGANVLDVVREAFKSGHDEEGMIVLDSVEYYSYVNYMTKYDWAIIMAVPVEMVQAEYSRVVMLQYIFALVILVLLMAIVHIIFSWKRSDRKINTDTLCNCGSRAGCLSMVDILERQVRKSVTIIYADLNNFKFVNDNYGHDTGDELLRIYCSCLTRIFARVGYIGRMGGDEFIIIAQDITEDEVLELKEKLMKELEKANIKLEYEYVLSSSFGYARREAGENRSLVDVLNEADRNMYVDKQSNS